MIGLALGFAYGCFGLAMLCCLYRVVRAPGLPDRLLALDTMTVNAIALLALFGIDRGTGLYFEAALLFAMVGFVSTVAYAKFILRGDIIE
ncbi:K+/H+ antiporter subunit F [Paracoccus yeei]|jgi:multicomponent K+:H+ antiporter subunit F|uniref:K+/H+ antiporter subunit F n=2 Tax=Paracoccus TaxID=265 RepID=A0A1V0GQJ7_9RHOB|nr:MULTISPECIES: K+/H+ antiporter subunit F [Paracoccus]ARC36111.1 K+/H+ antiporter subunit F [Paracoccus yeei]ATQ54669.1 K+/H+ antiporter subunit F [Paracoccus yeei]AWX92725.1 K+/H+ antiporter subunit F [Paracoccus mutanolyticus]AYF02052.1 Na+/H+ antiporter subunit F [Paracoccus yeei]MBY0136371.1 K+/H+ antiporter subunit F [Paracoccus yeei]